MPRSVLAVLLALAAASLALPPLASGRSQKAAVVAAVRAKVKAMGPQPRIACARHGRRAWRCTATVRRCRAGYRVTRARSAWRARAAGRRCTTQVAAPQRSAGAAPAGRAGQAAARPAQTAHATASQASTGAAAAPASAAHRPAERYFGFNDNGVRAKQLTADQDADLAAGAGASITRVTFDWRWAESRQGTINFAAYDDIYRASRARGIRPLWIVMFAPQWSWDASVTCDQWHQDCRYPPGADHADAWKHIVGELVRRYPQSAGIEVWNEPNLRAFWAPRPDAARYAKLLRDAHDAVKAVDPDMPVLGASLSNTQVTDASRVALPTFLTALYQAGGGPAMDAISFHPYPWGTDLGAAGLFAATFRQVRTIRDAFGDAGKPLWVTETGVSTTGPDAALRFTPDAQAATLVGLYRAIAAMPDVQAAIFHTLVETPGPDTDREPGYGVVRRDLTPKPAYCALAREAGGRGC